MRISYEKLVPYSFDVVLSQYFDYEHIVHVHPKTVGEYRLLDSGEGFVRYEHLWPKRWTGRKKTIVRHSYKPPNEMWFTFEEGYLKGTEVHSVLHDHGEKTLVQETYDIPIPDWKWLRPLVRRWTVRNVERIWDEDLDVEVCREGWPGVPEAMKNRVSVGIDLPRSPTPRGHLGRRQDFPEGKAVRVEVEETELLVIHREGRVLAVGNRCPHTGGPLHLGCLSKDEVSCPWHGATFDLETGKRRSGPSCDPLPAYKIEIEGDDLFIENFG